MAEKHGKTLTPDNGHFYPGRLPLGARLWNVREMVGPHDHEFYEIALISKGRGEHITSSRRVLTTVGDVWVIKPGRWHTYMAVKALDVYNCLIYPSLFRSLSHLLRQDPGAVELFWGGPSTQANDGCHLLRLDPKQRLQAEQKLDEIVANLRSTGSGGSGLDLAATGLLLQFLALLAHVATQQNARAAQRQKRHAQDQDGSLVACKGNASHARTPAVIEAIEILEERFIEPHSVSALAAEVGLSASHLRRVFRRFTGQAPLTYLADIRIQRACRMLAETSLSITEIASKVGWPDPNLFARRFRECLKVSPRAYRQKHQPLAHYASE